MRYTKWFTFIILPSTIIGFIILLAFTNNPSACVLTFLFASAIAFIFYIRELHYRERRQRNVSFEGSFTLSVLFLIPISVLFFVLFSFPQIRPETHSAVIDSFFAEAVAPMSEPTLTLVNAEHQKAIAELALRVTQDDSWFNTKFILLGGLLAALGGILVGRSIFNDGDKTKWQEHLEVLRSPIPSCIFAIAFIIAIFIDMHVRSNYIATQQLGQWITNSVEPILNCKKSVFSSYCEDSPFIPWERSLRQVGGMHEDFLYNMFQTPHIHFSTWLLYTLYMLTLYWLIAQYSARGITNDMSNDARMFLVSLFIIAHVSLGLFAFIGHSVPAAFDEKILLPHVGEDSAELWISGDKAGFVFLIVWLIMIYLSQLRLYTIFPQSSESSGAGVETMPAITMYAIIIAVFIVLLTTISPHIYVSSPWNERKRLGPFSINLADASGEKAANISIIVQMPREYVKWLHKYDLVDKVQVILAEPKYKWSTSADCNVNTTRRDRLAACAHKPACPASSSDRHLGCIVESYVTEAIDEIKWILCIVRTQCPARLEVEHDELVKVDERLVWPETGKPEEESLAWKVKNLIVSMIGAAARREASAKNGDCPALQTALQGSAGSLSGRVEDCEAASRSLEALRVGDAALRSRVEVYIEQLGGAKEAFYQMPDFVTTFSESRDFKSEHFKVKIIAKTSDVYLWLLKTKELQLLNKVQSVLHNNMNQLTLSRDICSAINEVMKPDSLKGTSPDYVKEVVVLYEPAKQ